MVGDDDVDGAVGDRGPQRLAVGGATDRRAALEERRAVVDVLGAEAEVVRTGLDGDPDALGLRGRDPRQRLGRGEVEDVGSGPGQPGRGDDGGDGTVLGVPGREARKSA